MDTVRRTRSYKKQIAEGRGPVPLADAAGGGDLVTALKANMQRPAAHDAPVFKETSASEIQRRRVLAVVGVVAAGALALYLLLRSVGRLQGFSEL
eukprot:g93.t1